MFIIIFLFFCECFLFTSPFYSRYNLVLLIILCLTLRLDFTFFCIFSFFTFFCGILYLILFIPFPSPLFKQTNVFNFSLLAVFLSSLLLTLRLFAIFSFSFNLTFFLFIWINDYITECVFCFSRTECFSLVYGIKLFILSEFMLFFCVF